MNSSGATLACFRMPRNVPVASLPCKGTTHPTAPSDVRFLSTTWLPRRRTCSKPSSSRARMACRPDTLRNLGLRRSADGRLKGSQEGLAHLRQRKLLKVEFRGLFQIGNCFLNGMALADCSNFGALRHITNHLPCGELRSGSLMPFQHLRVDHIPATVLAQTKTAHRLDLFLTPFLRGH